jgi:hypothetical protein
VKTQIVKLIFMFISVGTLAQPSSIKPLDINLENYQYPYSVQYITLNIQGKVLKMAYMDVKPANANGHVVMLLHGKISTVLTEDKRQRFYLIMVIELLFLIRSVSVNPQSHKHIQYSF